MRTSHTASRTRSWYVRSGGGGPRWWRRIITPWNLIWLVMIVWAAPRLLPHLGAVVGVEGTPIEPRYALTALDGTTLSPDALRGKVVLINFWATWCLPCRVEMPLLERMAERHRDAGLAVVGLSVDRGGEESVRTFLRERGITYPVAIVGADVERAFGGVRGYPTSILIDRAGVVRHVVIGPLAAASLELAVRRLLTANTSAADDLRPLTGRAGVGLLARLLDLLAPLPVHAHELPSRGRQLGAAPLVPAASRCQDRGPENSLHLANAIETGAVTEPDQPARGSYAASLLHTLEQLDVSWPDKKRAVPAQPALEVRIAAAREVDRHAAAGCSTGLGTAGVVRRRAMPHLSHAREV